MRPTLCLAILAALGCTPTIADDQGPDCTASVEASVIARVRDLDGVPIAEPTLTWTSAAFPEAQPCEASGDDSYVCGWEREGLLTVRADAWGYNGAQIAVEVPADECHVLTQQIHLTLESIDCPEIIRYGMTVEAQDEGGHAVLDAEAGWMPYGENWTGPEPCLSFGEGQFGCAIDHSGELELWVTSRQVGSYYAIVDVPFNACGPITQTVVAQLSR